MIRFPHALGALAALGLAVPAAAQHAGHAPAPQPQPEHAGHTMPAAPTPSAQAVAEQEAARTSIAVRALFTAGPPGSTASSPVREGEIAELRVRITDPTTGRPVTGLEPMAWVDVRRDTTATAMRTCQASVGAFVEATMHIKHGQINLTEPVEDLNGHYVVALARGGTLVVIDPVKGFGRTKMLTAVPLGAEGGDWASTPDDGRIFVTLPTRGEVVVVNTYSWKVEARIPVGGAPAVARMDPDGRRLWVAGASGGVAVIDAARMTVLGSIPVGAGPHAIAFSGDGKTVFVAARAAGSVAVIDAARLARIGEARTGAAPADVAWSAARGAAFVIDEAEGAMSVVDTRGTIAERIPFTPGLRSIRFAPDPAEGHAGHGGGGHEAAAGGGRLAFLLNPRVGTLQIYDVMARRMVRTLSGAPEPDQVAFTGSFAYIRAGGTPSVALIPLADPTIGALGPHDFFPSGDVPPGPVEGDSLGEMLIAQPGHDAVYAVNPRERMVYSYHYMEGMPVPHGGLTTYGFTPRAVRVVSRRVRETEPGVYAATLRVERAGDYDLVFRSPEPYLLACYPFTIAPDARRHSGLRVAADSVARLQPGRQTVRFRVTEEAGGAPAAGIADFAVILASTDGWRGRARAVPVGAGVYEATFDLRDAGMYYASYEIPSRGVEPRTLSSAMIQVRP